MPELASIIRDFFYEVVAPIAFVPLVLYEVARFRMRVSFRDPEARTLV